jgi:hypothetical protein
VQDYLCILHTVKRRRKAGLQSLPLAKSAVIPVFPDRIVYHHLAPTGRVDAVMASEARQGVNRIVRAWKKLLCHN